MSRNLLVRLLMVACFCCLGLRPEAQAQVLAPSAEIASTTWVTNYSALNGLWRETHAGGGIVFAGSATVGVDVPLGSQMSIGGESFTVVVRCVVPDVSNISGTTTKKGIFSLASGTGTPTAFINYFTAWFSGGQLAVLIRGNASADFRQVTVAKADVDKWKGQLVDVAVVRDSTAGTLKMYLNGTAVTGVENTGGAGASWTNTVDATYVTVGRGNGNGHFDLITRSRLFNYALSQDEIQEVVYRGVAYKQRWGKFNQTILNPDKNTWFNIAATTDWAGDGAMPGVVAVDTVNAELDVTTAGVLQGAKLPTANFNNNNLADSHVLTFEVANLTGGRSLQAQWGATPRGTAITSNRKVWIEFNPSTAQDLKLVLDDTGVFSVRRPQVRNLKLSNGNTFLNGGFESYTGAGDFADWSETVTGSSTITAGNIAPYSGETNLVFNIDSSGNTAQISKSPMVGGKKYRLRFQGKINNASGTNHVWVLFGSSASISNAGEAQAHSLTTSWAEYVTDFIAFDSTFVIRATGVSSISKTIDIDNVMLEELACANALDLGAGVGYQAEDFSVNNVDGLITESPTQFAHHYPERAGTFIWSRTANGYLSDIDRVVLPSGARITSIVANTAGTPTITVGTASGASADIVASVALAAGRTDLTLLKRFTSTDKIYVTTTSSAKVTYTISYVVGD